jgi:hypothetical protein
MSASSTCACGCGGKVRPRRRFIHGHNKRTPEARAALAAESRARWADPTHRASMSGEQHPNWVAEPTYSAVHHWLNRNYPKTGVCEHCGDSGPSGMTEYALIGERHARDRSQYAELCCPCHQRFDAEKRAVAA